MLSKYIIIARYSV